MKTLKLFSVELFVIFFSLFSLSLLLFLEIDDCGLLFIFTLGITELGEFCLDDLTFLLVLLEKLEPFLFALLFS